MPAQESEYVNWHDHNSVDLAIKLQIEQITSLDDLGKISMSTQKYLEIVILDR